MQVGVITIGGRQVGVIMQTEEGMDKTTPPMEYGAFGGTGNSQLGDEVYGSGAGQRDDTTSGRPRHSHRHPGGPERHHRQDGTSAGEERRGPPSRSQDRGDIPYTGGEGNPFDRERYRKELEEKPWLREKIKRISLGENQYDTSNLAVLETMMNRASVRGTSLEAQARRHRTSGKDEGGYYAGYANSYDPKMGEMADRNIDKALKGSNITNYATDNSSGSLAAGEKVNGRFVHHRDISGESFFSPGSAEPAFRDRWRKMNKKAKEYEHPDPSADGIAPPNKEPST